MSGQVGVGLGRQFHPSGQHDLRDLVHLWRGRPAAVAGGEGRQYPGAAEERLHRGLFKVISGPPFNAVPFDFAAIKFQAEGTLMVTFRDGNFATFGYTIDGVTQTKQITRDVFAPPGTMCQ